MDERLLELFWCSSSSWIDDLTTELWPWQPNRSVEQNSFTKRSKFYSAELNLEGSFLQINTAQNNVLTSAEHLLWRPEMLRPESSVNIMRKMLSWRWHVIFEWWNGENNARFDTVTVCKKLDGKMARIKLQPWTPLPSARNLLLSAEKRRIVLKSDADLRPCLPNGVWWPFSHRKKGPSGESVYFELWDSCVGLEFKSTERNHSSFDTV